MDGDSRLARRLRQTGWLLCGMAVLFVAAGVWTRFWPTTEGVLEQYERVSYRPNGSGKGRVGYAPVYWSSVRYQYTVMGEQYTGRLACICLPIGIVPRSNDGVMRVSYLPQQPSVAVIRTGPFFIVPGLLALLGFAALYAAVGIKAVIARARRLQEERTS